MKYKIKMIGLDLDGTLLNEKKELTAYTKEVLNRAIEKGVVVLVATGRPLKGVPQELLTFPGMRYVLTANGARIIDQKENKILYENLVPKEKVKKILDILEQYDTLKEIYFDGQGYASAAEFNRAEEFFASEAMRNYVTTTRFPVEDIKAKLEEENRASDKVQGVFVSQEERKSALKELEQLDGLCITGALVNNIEINAVGVNKGLGLLKLGELLGIEREEIMACGDGLNDLEMLRTVGFGVAMDNADPLVKEAADYVTESNENDGVAKAIEKFVLI